MIWLVIAILSYFILAFVNIGDKIVLGKTDFNPKSYVFYCSLFGALVFLLIPFLPDVLYNQTGIAVALLAGFVFNIGMYWFFKALSKFDVSQIVPATNGIMPIFTYLFISLWAHIWPNVFDFKPFTYWQAIAFVLLLLGIFLINISKEYKINFQSAFTSGIAALLFSFAFSLMKGSYLFFNGIQGNWHVLGINIPLNFLTAFFWIKAGGLLFALVMLLDKELRTSFSFAKVGIRKSLGMVTLVQVGGMTSSLLQDLAIFLAPASFVAVVNASQGTQYVFLMLLVYIISRFKPDIMQEDFSGPVLTRKLIATAFIIAGLAVFAVK